VYGRSFPVNTKKYKTCRITGYNENAGNHQPFAETLAAVAGEKKR
jgi:hypothetical protein